MKEAVSYLTIVCMYVMASKHGQYIRIRIPNLIGYKYPNRNLNLLYPKQSEPNKKIMFYQIVCLENINTHNN